MTIKSALREVNNAVLDLQSADYNTFEHPLERLAHALNSDDLKPISDQLRAQADFEKFLSESNNGGSMMGSARLNWPASRQEELGLVIHLIDRSAKDPHWFLSLAHTYYYSGRKIVGDIRKITTAVIIPFNRDYEIYVNEHVPSSFSPKTQATMTADSDKIELLQALFEMAQATGQRPSVVDAKLRYFPEWDQERLMSATEALLEEGTILNPRGGMYNVDLSSEGRKRAQEKIAAAEAGVTYNIGSMHNSPLQHVSSGAHGSQIISYSTSDLHAVVELYRKHVDELGLNDAQRRRADAQVATIEAQLQDDPDPTIIKAAGSSLKTIVEGAIGGAAGNLLASTSVWTPLLSLFS